MTEPSPRDTQLDWRNADPVTLTGGLLALVISASVMLGLGDPLIWLAGASIIAVGMVLLVLATRPRER